MLQLVINNQ